MDLLNKDTITKLVIASPQKRIRGKCPNVSGHNVKRSVALSNRPSDDSDRPSVRRARARALPTEFILSRAAIAETGASSRSRGRAREGLEGGCEKHDEECDPFSTLSPFLDATSDLFPRSWTNLHQ